MEMRTFRATSKMMNDAFVSAPPDTGTDEFDFPEEEYVDDIPLEINYLGDKSIFDPISIQTFDLGLCEFDFNNGGKYLENLSVDPQMNTSSFRIKCGTVRKTGKYPFYRYVTNEIMNKNKFPDGKGYNSGVFSSSQVQVPHAYYEPFSGTEVNKYDLSDTNEAQMETRRQNAKTERLNKEDTRVNAFTGDPYTTSDKLTGFLGGVLGAVESIVASFVQKGKGLVRGAILGNVYDHLTIQDAFNVAQGFFNPDLIQFYEDHANANTENGSEALPTDIFEPSSPISETISPKNVYPPNIIRPQDTEPFNPEQTI